MAKNKLYTREQMQKLINEKLAGALKTIKECEQLGDEYGISFGWDLAYGMGGYYYPQRPPKDEVVQQALEKLTDEEKEALGIDENTVGQGDGEWYDSDAGWRSSSQSC